ncbi:hypothetical protein FH966_10415 [Lentibacillus cibarius]|uniref:Uncharacterized protein n=1 Tax=Lentibacillus cibarius TaxID=2583219 RepID=A0A549YJL4_9BACI|nr:hypothetical protein [Lentibacillus cibarius]TRM12061.1 hypothetical protein FH966_10415 [Lentibacillus cibarius]
MNQSNRQTTIIVEGNSGFLKSHPLIKANKFVSQPNLSASLSDIIALIQEYKMDQHIIYLYQPSHKKQQALWKLRNLFLPELNIKPLPYPNNHAEAVHLLFLVASNPSQTLQQNLFAWNVLKGQMKSFVIQHAKAKKILKTKDKITSEDKYMLYQNDFNQKKLNKGLLNALLEQIKGYIKGYKLLIIQETAEKKYHYLRSVNQIETTDDTVKISICAVKDLGVESNG